jgi:hypothetical protein
MMARAMVGGATENRCVVSPASIVLFLCCLFFSGMSFAQTEAEAEASAEPAVIEQAPVDVGAELEAILKKNKKCLNCHKRERVKTLEDGAELSLQVHREDYTGSAHGEIACVGCHEAIGNRKHPSKKTNITISSQRDYAKEINQSCRNCHDKKFTQYQGSIHASLVTQGSDKAPLCSDCHSAHAVETMEVYQPDTGLPCKRCHENIFIAYSESVHGTARATGNVIRDEHIQAPICMDCHSSHNITAVEIGDTLRSQCLDCHENVPLLHSQWLPNAGTHLDIVSCAVCHAPFAKHRFDLHLYDNIAQVPVGQQESYKLFQEQLKQIEKEGGDVDPLAVWKLIEESDEENIPSEISLRSRMEVRSGVWAHQIASKSFAVRTCDSCHQKDSRKGLDVTVSLPQEGGQIQRYKTGSEGLDSVGKVKSVSDFYALGGNPNKLLDIMVLLSFISGFAIPIGHYTLGKMIKEKMVRGEQ